MRADLSGEWGGRRIVFLALSRDSAHSTAQWTHKSYFRSLALENPRNHPKILRANILG